MNKQTFDQKALRIIAILKSASAKLLELGKKHEMAAQEEQRQAFKKAA